MQLKNTYSAREVAALTGLSARQLQWWDARRLFAPAVAPKRTAAGGFTERRYTPVDLLELIVLAVIRARFFRTGFLRSFATVTLGGAIIVAVSAALGSAA